MFAAAVAPATGHIRFADLGLHPEVFSVGFFTLRWYSLAYIAGIVIGWWYLLKLLAQPGAPMARRHADDLVFYATLGFILGGRIGYVLFYNLPLFLDNPLYLFKVWDGGMSFHGGLMGVILVMFWFARRTKRTFFQVSDFIAPLIPFGLGAGRLGNFINGELWGRVAGPEVPWAIVFPGAGPLPRHPSQLYEALLEGLLLAIVMLVASCGGGGGSFKAPRDLDNACAIIRERPAYYRAMVRTEKRWGVPVAVQMASIHQESKFIGDARTPHQYALGIIPIGRQSSAYGYSQALDGTWEEYQQETGNRRAQRDNINDATDFMGWYMDGSAKRLGISKWDARSQYLAYHEGKAGYAKGSYRSKPWLPPVARDVQVWALRYEQQLATCPIR